MYRMIASRTPVGYEQNMVAGQNWVGDEPGEAHINTNGIMRKGVFEVPADPAPAGGLFAFRHRFPVQVVECHFDMGTGMSWNLDRIREGSGTVDRIFSGGPGTTRLTRINDELPILNPGDTLKITSSGVAAGQVSKATIYVQNAAQGIA